MFLRNKAQNTNKDILTKLKNKEITEEYFLSVCGEMFLKNINSYYRALQIAYNSEQLYKRHVEKLNSQYATYKHNEDCDKRIIYRVEKQTIKNLMRIHQKNINLANIARINAAQVYLTLYKANYDLNTNFTFTDCEKAWKNSDRYYDVIGRDLELFKSFNPVHEAFIKTEKATYDLLKDKFVRNKKFYNKRTYELAVKAVA